MTESITWQEWLTIYFLVGAMVMALLVKLKASNQNTFESRLAKIMQDKLDQTKSPTQRFIDQRLLPGIFFGSAMAILADSDIDPLMDCLPTTQ